jgi:hypothetical protein
MVHVMERKIRREKKNNHGEKKKDCLIKNDKSLIMNHHEDIGLFYCRIISIELWKSRA